MIGFLCRSRRLLKLVPYPQVDVYASVCVGFGNKASGMFSSVLGIAMADDAASLQLAHVIAEAVFVATISTLGVRVGVLVLLRPQLTDRIVARACARMSSLCNCSACVPY